MNTSPDFVHCKDIADAIGRIADILDEERTVENVRRCLANRQRARYIVTVAEEETGITARISFESVSGPRQIASYKNLQETAEEEEE